ncbi:fatty-acyl-CoA synthase [Rhizobium sp. SG_E_25_P2]|uniref:AMP-binding protein n=1 Tax=Rhizobium sp. SG_E_25_P2 TaxID=2879942 RepID=UPI002475517A|nr:AMP-binding protein [Rhizobium sp. SG_E_25_P2]MDH6267168.1 fatty-acyl-CoA synthase [Rhizobium sp. SG_E_25_P2]
MTRQPPTGVAELRIEDPLACRARQVPDKCAVVEWPTGRATTYSALDAMTARAGGLIQSLTLTTGQQLRIAVIARNSLLQLAVAFACQRIGAVFMPLNWRLGGAELAAIAEDCTPALLLYTEEFAASVASIASGPDRLIMPIEGPDGFEARLADATPAPHAAFPGQTPAIMLYTSGTTGTPKGVVITAANALYASLNFAAVGDVGGHTVALCDLPFFHTIGLCAIARTTIALGGTLAISDRFLPERTLACLGDETLSVSHYFAVPQMAAALRKDPSYDAAKLARLKAIFIGGAPLSKQLIDLFLEDGVALVNGYGMSEAGTAIHMPLDKQAVAAHPGAVGYPAPLIEIRLVGPDGVDAAEGEAGEIWLRGPSVTPGYWNKPQETEKAFVDGWYRTGDLGLRSESGAIYVPDRLKDMYISGGENVYPAEVEAVLAAHPKVGDVAVIGVADPKWGETGVAYVVSRDPSLTADELSAYCAEKLAAFKRPTDLRFIDTIPRTASGKAQKHVLKQTRGNQA